MTIRDAIVITRMEAKGSDGWVREALEICARVASEESKQTKIGRSSKGLTTNKRGNEK